jgi:2-polyprenyl-6-methoxyphenol hydroxylase-like FAD-dependent oxidoreductase
MFTAILLAEAGLRVTLIDREERTAAFSYACGLHPRSLKLLSRLQMLDDVMGEARRIEKVALYSGQRREAEIVLSSLPVEFPFVLVLPQSQLERILVQRLKKLGCEVLWHHRLSTLQPHQDSVEAEVDQLAGTSTGYIVPHWEWVVRRTIQLRASFVVGADGHRSLVRRLMGIEHEQVAAPEFYVAYEFETDADLPNELCLVAEKHAQSILWPMNGRRCRWSFLLPEVQSSNEFPAKDRNPAWTESTAVADRTLARLKMRLAERAPWFKSGVKNVHWAMDIQFQHRLARQFGRGRCWLAGDAAHQTSPGGIQSMNAGLLEAEDLATALTDVLRNGASMDRFAEYEKAHLEIWQQLLSVKGAPKPEPTASAWVREHANELVPMIPATGPDLSLLLKQIGLTSA